MNYFVLLKQLLPEAVLVLTGLTVLATALSYESKKGKSIPSGVLIGMVTVGLLLATTVLLIKPDQAQSGCEGLLAQDGLSRLVKWVVMAVGILGIWLPTAKKEIRHLGEYYALIVFGLVGLLLASGTQHLLFLFVALELASLSMYLLAGFSKTGKAAEASLKYFLFGGVSAAFLLFGLSWIYGFTHQLTFGGIAQAMNGGSSLMVMAGLLMVLVGLGFKMAAAPFHYWAPDVYQGSPATTVSLIASVSKIVGLVVMVRLLGVAFPAVKGSCSWADWHQGWSVWLAVLSVVSIMVGNILAIAQKSVRRMLAYSAVANTGYLLVPLSAGGIDSAASAIFYVIVYGVATMGAMAVVAWVERESGDDQLGSFAGLVHRCPMAAIAMLVCLASLAGIPPLAGFYGKFAMFSKALVISMKSGQVGLAWLVGLGAAMSAVSLYYYLRVLKEIFVKEGKTTCTCSAMPLSHQFAIMIPACVLVVLGVMPPLLAGPVQAAIATVLR